MPYLYQAVLKLASVTNIPADDALNVFHFVDPASSAFDPVAAENIWAALTDFCNNVPSGGASDLASYLGEQITRAAGGCEVLVYGKDDFDGAVPFSSPQYSNVITLDAAAAGSTLPAEVAMAISFHGDLDGIQETAVNPSPPPAIIRPKARRRGRVYLGPLMDAAGTEDPTSHDLLPSSAFRNVCTGIMVDLAAAANAANLDWSVYSRADGASYPVVGGWLDYAFDTQRRRGTAPIARSLWP